MPPQIVFLHIPKSAGTSLRRTFYELFDKNDIFWIIEPTTFFYPRHKTAGKVVVGGHKSISFYPRNLNALYCAIVRDPVERVISLYSYYTRPDLASTKNEEMEREKQLSRWITKGIDPDSLYNSIKNCRAFRKEISNLQCRYLSRFGANLRGVKKTLSNYDCLIGSTDHMEAYQLYLSKLVGIDVIRLGTVNSSQENYTKEISIDDKTVALIERLNDQDTLLFNFVNQQHNGTINTMKIKSRYEKLKDALKKTPLPGKIVDEKKIGRDFRGHRLSMLEKAEKIWPRGNNNKLPWPLAGAMISTQLKVLYRPIAKCACTSLKNLMIELSEVEHQEKIRKFGVHIITDRFNTGLQLKDLPMQQAKDIIKSEDYFKFTVIREPMERLISAYIEKFVQNRKILTNQHHTNKVLKIVYGKENIDHANGITFREFVNTITSEPEKTRDPHWISQHMYLKGVNNYSKVYRINQMQELSDDLSKFTSKPITIGHRNQSGKKAEATPPKINNLLVDLLPSELDNSDQLNINSFKDPAIEKKIREAYPEDYALYNKTFSEQVIKSDSTNE